MANNGASVSRGPASHDKLVQVSQMMLGSRVTATLKSGAQYTGNLASAITPGESSITLRQAILVGAMKNSMKPSFVVNSRDLLQLELAGGAKSVETGGNSSAGQQSKSRDSFKTDVEVSNKNVRGQERVLQAWGASSSGMGIEENLSNLSLENSNSQGVKWDQFAANERLTGAKTDYHEEIYTTKLDRSTPDFRQREARAAQLEREILKGGGALASNAHVAEERGVVDERNLNEEDRYSSVIRGPEAYVPPGARKGNLARVGTNGTSTPSPPPTAPRSSAATGNPTKQQIFVDPAILSQSTTSTSSRLAAANSSTSRIPAVTGGQTQQNLASGKVGQSLERDMAQFVESELVKLSQKKQLYTKEKEKQEKDSKLASLLEFSQNFKLRPGAPKDLASIIGGDSKSNTTSPAVTARTLTTTNTSSAGKTSPSPAAKPSLSTKLIAEIPPFNPQKAAKPAGEATTSQSTTAGTSTAASSSKINAKAAPFVFKPNPNASTFTPGSSVPASSVTAAPKSSGLNAAANPFFGTKSIKKGSATMHVKEDFTPFKFNHVNDPSSVAPNWNFTGESYRNIYPIAGPPGAVVPNELKPGGVDHQQPSPLPAAAAVPPPPFGMYPPQQFQPQQNFARFGGQAPPAPSPIHLQQTLNPNLQFQHFPPPNLQFATSAGPHGPPMFNSPQMQPQQAGYLRYTPFPTPPGPPQ